MLDSLPWAKRITAAGARIFRGNRWGEILGKLPFQCLKPAFFGENVGESQFYPVLKPWPTAAFLATEKALSGFENIHPMGELCLGMSGPPRSEATHVPTRCRRDEIIQPKHFRPVIGKGLALSKKRSIIMTRNGLRYWWSVDESAYVEKLTLEMKGTVRMISRFSRSVLCSSTRSPDHLTHSAEPLGCGLAWWKTGDAGVKALHGFKLMTGIIGGNRHWTKTPT